jgi:hypothetical protein
VRRIAPFILLVLFLFAPTAPAVAARDHKKASPQCPRAHSQVVVANTQATVYLAPKRPQNPEFLGVYGCSYKNKRSYYFGEVDVTPYGDEGLELNALAGSDFAYAENGTGYWMVTVRDLATGKIVHSVPTGTPAHPEPPRTENGLTRHNVGIGPTTAIVVKSDGAVAWIAQDAVEGLLPYSYQVHVLDKTGSRVLAVGPEIEPHSLALVGSTLYWLQGGKPMSATLN